MTKTKETIGVALAYDFGAAHEKNAALRLDVPLWRDAVAEVAASAAIEGAFAADVFERGWGVGSERLETSHTEVREILGARLRLALPRWRSVGITFAAGLGHERVADVSSDMRLFKSGVDKAMHMESASHTTEVTHAIIGVATGGLDLRLSRHLSIAFEGGVVTSRVFLAEHAKVGEVPAWAIGRTSSETKDERKIRPTASASVRVAF